MYCATDALVITRAVNLSGCADLEVSSFRGVDSPKLGNSGRPTRGCG